MIQTKSEEKCNLSVAIPRSMDLEKAQMELGRLSKGLAHEARVKIVTMLARRAPEEKCFCGDIVKELPLAQSTVSQHLKILKDTGWVQGEIQGPKVCYCLVDGIFEYYKWLLMRCINVQSANKYTHKLRKGR